ncbi:DUF3850 domain-containing protein [Streptococcus agalactiae]|nr:DUF3850 domain-containing protein [Streptococcus agalactiae]
MTQHSLKCCPEHFAAVKNGSKNFECCYNDRNFQIGDQLSLMEYSQFGYTGRYLDKTISYVLEDFEGLADGYVILGLERTSTKVFGVPFVVLLMIYTAIFLLIELYLHFG